MLDEDAHRRGRGRERLHERSQETVMSGIGPIDPVGPPGDERDVSLVPFGGKQRICGFNNLVDADAAYHRALNGLLLPRLMATTRNRRAAATRCCSSPIATRLRRCRSS